MATLVEQLQNILTLTGDHVHESEILAHSAFTPAEALRQTASELGMSKDVVAIEVIKTALEALQAHLISAETLITTLTGAVEELK